MPIVGRLPGARRMYVLPADQGEFHLVGSQVIKRIARSQESSGVAGVYEATSFSGRSGATMPRHRHLEQSRRAAGVWRRARVGARRPALDAHARRLRQHPGRHAARMDHAVGPDAVHAVHDRPAGGPGDCGDGDAAHRRVDSRRHSARDSCRQARARVAGGRLSVGRRRGAGGSARAGHEQGTAESRRRRM